MAWRDRLYILAFYPIDEWRKAAYRIATTLFFIIVCVGGLLFHAAKADDSIGGEVTGGIALSDALSDAIFQHPAQRQSGARACQAHFVLGQIRAESKVNLSLQVSGEREIASNFNRNPSRQDQSSALSRGYNRDLDNVLDMELTARYPLYDWGVSNARIRSQQARLDASRLIYSAGIGERLQDILRIMMQLESARAEEMLRQTALADMQPHMTAIEAQGKAGSIGLAEVRASKLLLLNAEIALQRAERRVDEVSKELSSAYRMTYEDGLPLLLAFLQRRPSDVPVIAAEDWSSVRLTELTLLSEQQSRLAIENEQHPRLDGVVESTLFDLTDFESEYQLVGRLEVRFPLYDGGANKARRQEKDWQISELRSERESKLRDHQQNTEQGRLIISRRLTEIETVKTQLEDLRERYASLSALIGNSLVSRQELLRLVGDVTEKENELSQLKWQQEFGYVRALWLADQLQDLFGILTGDHKC